MANDLYETLQVSPTAEPEVIEAAYRRLALKYHPDKNPSPDADERMKQLNRAYEILQDPARRAKYDAWRNRTRSTPPPRAESSNASSPPKDSSPPPKAEPKSDPPPASSYASPPSYSKPRSRSRLRTIVWIIVAIVVIGGVGRSLVMQTANYGASVARTYTVQAISSTAISQAASSGAAPTQASTPPFPVGTPQAQRTQYACFSPEVEAFIYQNGQIVPSGLAYRNGDELMVFGQVGDFYFVGVNENQQAFYVKKSNVCAQRPLDYYSPTPTRLIQPTRESTVSPARMYRISSQNAPTEWGVFHEMNNTRISICATTAEIRSGPSETYPVVSHMSIGDFATAFGWVGSWFYIGRDSNYHDYFVNNSFVCALNQSEPTQGNNSQSNPVTTQNHTPVAVNPCQEPKDDSFAEKMAYLICLDANGLSGNRKPDNSPPPENNLFGPCDSYVYKQWASGKSTRYMPECTPTPRTP